MDEADEDVESDEDVTTWNSLSSILIKSSMFSSASLLIDCTSTALELSIAEGAARPLPDILALSKDRTAVLVEHTLRYML
jgi:hypothetical protein